MAGTAILDLACGTGSLFSFASGKRVAEVTGVDRSPSMLALADEKLRAGKGSLPPAGAGPSAG